jgi:hypothetical protein
MMKEMLAMIYFKMQVFGSGFQQFMHLNYVELVDFNWDEAWVIVNGLLLETPVSEVLKQFEHAGTSLLAGCLASLLPFTKPSFKLTTLKNTLSQYSNNLGAC